MKVTDKNGQAWQFEESEARYRKSVYGYAVYNDQVLLILDPRSGKWELPGGGVDDGETDAQALVREVKEETGLEADVSKMKLIECVKGYYKSLDHDFVWKTDRNYFEIKIKNPDGPILKQGNGEDTSEAKWINLDDIKKIDLAEVDKSIILSTINI